MDQKVCFLFGHATAPSEITKRIQDSAERHYLQYGIRIFVIGNRGNFDRCALTALKALKRQYADISLILLLAYHPSEHAVSLADEFDSTLYPPLESVPRRYAIVRANQYMADAADSVICYVEHFGNARNLLEYAQRRGKRIENIAEYKTTG